MPRYWVIAPVESKPPELFERVWQSDLANSCLSIGWSQLGDVSKMSREQIAEAVASTYRDKPAPARSLVTNMIWNFHHEIRPGDSIIARRGRKALAGVGIVTQPAVDAPGKIASHNHRSFIEVSWLPQPRDKAFPSVVFPMQTLAELSEEDFRSFAAGPGPTPVKLAEQTEAPEDLRAFVLEKYLEEFIVSNFATIFKGDLRIYEDAEGHDGQQYSTDIGPIDILAVEPKSKGFVVIELKRGRPSDQVVGQVLRYMGWVKKNLCTDGQAVKGLVICSEPDPKLSYALEMTENVSVRYYRVSFTLREAP